MSEFKTAKELEFRALYIIRTFSERVNIKIGENKKAFVDWNKLDVQWMAAELLDVYTQGVNEWIEKTK